MEVFFLTLSQMFMMFAFILAGFILRKINILPTSSDFTMSQTILCIHIDIYVDFDYNICKVATMIVC